MMGVNRNFLFVFIILVATLLSLATNNSIGCRFAVFMILASCIIRGCKEKSLYNPYFLFSTVPISLVVYNNLSDLYMVDLSVETWILAIINMFAFLFALVYTPNYKSVENCIGAGDGNKLIRNTIFLTLLGLFPTYYRIIVGSLMPLTSVFQLFTVAGLVCALKTRKKVVIMLVLVAIITSFIVYVSKTAILSILLSILIGFSKYYPRDKVKEIKHLFFAVVGVFVMVFSFSFANQDRLARTANESVDYYSTYGKINWEYHNLLFMPYMYLTTPWTNLQYVTETQNTRTYGLWFLKPFLGYLQIDSLFKSHYDMRAYSSFNTYTFIAVHYKDFGYWGSVVLSAFLGFFTKKIYSRFTLSKSPLDVASYVLVGQAVLEMFFSNEFFTQSFPFTIVIIMGIYKFILCRENIIELESPLE